MKCRYCEHDINEWNGTIYICRTSKGLKKMLKLAGKDDFIIFNEAGLPLKNLALRLKITELM
jgi:hypothetical protein